ncbi:large ribosomal subunit protein P1-like isoform X2 [Phascolarctos cinereus]|uniref:60S acidic ribosomal protein P1-like isoform X2 n=1 Tax=Phascolarctos cinereus TaxID=38626 RepID=A0A6P5KV53_PHACI|nr:60S acidic ribosomal protein P1-like isoform X2 [Phascolarctos cinereus]
MAISKLTCIYSALILYDDDVTALSNVNIASLICNVGVSGPAPTAGGAAPAGGVSPASSAAPAEVKKKEEAEKEESEESNDDMGFGLFD